MNTLAYFKLPTLILSCSLLFACGTATTDYKSSLYEGNLYITTLTSYAKLPTCTEVIITKCKTKATLHEVALAAQEYNDTLHEYSVKLDANSDTTSAAAANKEALAKINSLAHRTDILMAIQ